MLDIFVFCAERSGDSLGFSYIQKILKDDPGCKISGVLGPKLSSLDIEKFMDIQSFSVMGFTAVLKKIFSLIQYFYAIKKKILASKAKTLLLIDSPDFTLRLAKSLKKSGYKGHIIQYVCPSIWAWRCSRKKIIEQYIDELLCLLPFEPALFHDSKVKTKLVEHPIVNEIKTYKYPFSLKEIKGKKILLLMPGSRLQEIKKNLPLQLKAAHYFKDLVQCLLVSDTKHLIAITKILIKYKATPFLIEPQAKFDIMKKAHVALAKCGSSTLELALHKTPSVIMYNTSKFDRFLAKYIFKIKLKYFSLPNLISNKSIFEEHIKEPVKANKLRQAIENLQSKKNYDECKKKCIELELQMQNLLPNS